jgi:hypothetical protein
MISRNSLYAPETDYGQPLRNRVTAWVTVWLYGGLRGVCLDQDLFHSTNHKVPQVSFCVKVWRTKFARNAQFLPVSDFFKEWLGAFKLSEG